MTWLRLGNSFGSRQNTDAKSEHVTDWHQICTFYVNEKKQYLVNVYWDQQTTLCYMTKWVYGCDPETKQEP